MKPNPASIDSITPTEWDNTHKQSSQKDNVNNPDHYNFGKIECIDYLEDNLKQGFTSYLDGNIKKYLHRWQYKEKPLEDLQKARWYLDRLILKVSSED
mgnify:CR=1 FL=1